MCRCSLGLVALVHEEKVRKQHFNRSIAILVQANNCCSLFQNRMFFELMFMPIPLLMFEMTVAACFFLAIMMGLAFLLLKFPPWGDEDEDMIHEYCMKAAEIVTFNVF